MNTLQKIVSGSGQTYYEVLGLGEVSGPDPYDSDEWVAVDYFIDFVDGRLVSQIVTERGFFGCPAHSEVVDTVW